MKKKKGQKSYKIEKKCINCGKVFFVQRYKKDTAKYCSRKCIRKINIKKCQYCGKEFCVADCCLKQKCCSKECSDKNRRKYTRIDIRCKTCDKKFSITENLKDTSKYCSKKCYHTVEKLSLKCKKCGKAFERYKWLKNGKNDYCSKTCYRNREDDIFVNCDGCGKKIKIFPSLKKYYSTHYCSQKCYIKYGPLGRLTDNLDFNNNYQKFVRKIRHCSDYYKWRDAVLERGKNKCEQCNSKKALTVHHKYVTMYDFVKKYNFDVDSIYKDRMFFDVNNGEVLCRRCHAKEHTNF